MPSAAGRNITYPKLKVDSLRIPQGGMAFAGIPVMKLPTPSTVKSQRARARKLLQERQKHTLLACC